MPGAGVGSPKPRRDRLVPAVLAFCLIFVSAVAIFDVIDHGASAAVDSVPAVISMFCLIALRRKRRREGDGRR